MRGPHMSKKKKSTDEHTFKAHLCTEMGAGIRDLWKNTQNTSAHIPFGFPRAQMLVTGLISGPRELLINLSFGSLFN